MPTEYRNVEYRLHESLVQIQEMLTLLEFEQELLDAVIDCKNLIKTKRYKVAVMGEFKRGKSSLINALLGSRILPADATPTTATINRITYGIEPKTIITYKDGGVKEISIGELSDYVTKTAPDGEARAMHIKEATVYFPSVICQNYIDIIDTPGLNDEARMTQITIEMIANVDAVIVPIHARAPFSETEKKFVCQLIESDGINNIVFVVTFMDQLDEDDYVYENFMEYIKRRIQNEVFTEFEKRQTPSAIVTKAHLLLDDLSITGISSALALDSFISNNREKLRKSRFEEFSTSLLHVVTAKQMENAVRKTIEHIRHVVAAFDSQNQKRLAGISAKIQKNEENEIIIKKYCDESRKFLDTVFASDFDNLQNAINKLNAYKNFIIKEFISSLSTVRVNSHSAIANVLRETTSRMSDIINEQQRSGVNAEIKSIFEEAALKFRQRQKTEIYECIEGSEIYEGMLRFVDAILHNAKFTWNVSPIPKVANLAECDVIDRVKHAADASVNNYIKDMESVVLTIRKNWFAQTDAHTKQVHAALNDSIWKSKESYDIQYKAHIKNYNVLAENSKKILSQCEMLWEEFIKEE